MCKVLQTVSVQICPAEMGSQAGFHNCQVSELHNIRECIHHAVHTGSGNQTLRSIQPYEKLLSFFNGKTDIVLINIISH